MHFNKIKTKATLSLLWVAGLFVYVGYRHGSFGVFDVSLKTGLGLFAFALAGFISAIIFLAFVHAKQRSVRIGVILAYAISFPFAIWFAVVGGLAFAEFGVVYGIAVIGLGVVVGWCLGHLYAVIANFIKQR